MAGSKGITIAVEGKTVTVAEDQGTLRNTFETAPEMIMTVFATGLTTRMLVAVGAVIVIISPTCMSRWGKKA